MTLQQGLLATPPLTPTVGPPVTLAMIWCDGGGYDHGKATRMAQTIFASFNITFDLDSKLF